MGCVNEQGFGPLHLLAELATTAGALYELRSRMSEIDAAKLMVVVLLVCQVHESRV